MTILRQPSALTQEIMTTAKVMGQMAVEIHGAPAARLQALPLCLIDPDLALWIGVLPTQAGIAVPRLCDEHGAILTHSTYSGRTPTNNPNPRLGEQVTWFMPSHLARWYPRVCAWLSEEVERQPLAFVAGMLVAEAIIRVASRAEPPAATMLQPGEMDPRD